MIWTAEKALTRWQDLGLLTAEEVAELRGGLDQGHSNRGVRIFAVIGAVLVGLGAILFVSSNWAHMGPSARMALLIGTYAAVVGGAVVARNRRQPRVAEALWLLSTMVMGANIFLIAQIFNHELTYWQGTLRWMLGALILGWALQSRLQAAVAIPLGIMTLGWIDSGGGWFFDDQLEFLFEDEGLRPILPLIGIGLISLSLLFERSKTWSFLRGSCCGWGLALIVVPAILSTAGRGAVEGFFRIDGTIKQLTLLAVAALLMVAALILGKFRSRMSRILLGSTATLFAVVLVQSAGSPWISADVVLFVGYVLAVFALSLLTIWTGAKAGDVVLVNVGMVTSALLILIQYFSWSFALFDRSLVFVFGGLVLLGLAVVLEKKRRALLQTIQHERGASR